MTIGEMSTNSGTQGQQHQRVLQVLQESKYKLYETNRKLQQRIFTTIF